MQFQADKVNTFLNVFRTSMQQIRNFPGVHQLELHRDVSDSNIFYTLSTWENGEALENYRQSALFKGVWAETKLLFAAKPLAYSLRKEIAVAPNNSPE